MLLAAALLVFPVVGESQDQPTPPSADVQEIVKLSQSKMSDEVIINYIKNSNKTYRLNADDLLYLSGQGVSQAVIGALQKSSPGSQIQSPGSPASTLPVQVSAPASTSNAAAQQAPAGYPPGPGLGAPAQNAAVEATPEVNFNYFHEQLAPFGTWVDVDGVAYWRPDSAVRANPDWRPYYDMGQWTETENGLFWQSEYTWGDIPFHYGRWVRHPAMGWLWAPDYTWGPAWVFWRHAEADNAIGWAPLPVGAVWVDGAFMFHGARVALDFDFGLGEDVFTFVEYGHFHEGFFRLRGREFAWHIHGERFHSFYHRSVLRNEFARDAHGRFVNHGIGRERVQHLTHVEHAKFEERHPVGDRGKATVAKTPTGRSGQPSPKPTTQAGNATPQVSKVFRPPPPQQQRTQQQPTQPQPRAQQPAQPQGSSKKK